MAQHQLPLAARLEDALNRRRIPVLKARGWRPHVIPFLGYGSYATGEDPRFVRVLARLVMRDPDARDADEIAGDVSGLIPGQLGETMGEAMADAQRGWRSFAATPVPYLPVTVSAGSVSISTRADRSGYLDVVVRGHDLPAGWQTVTVSSPVIGEVAVPVLVIDPATTPVGLVSDIDDTVMVTQLPRAMIAAWNTFVRHTNTRKPVPGMADLYRTIAERNPGLPVFYLSTGAWNVVPTLETFLRNHSFPEGPMLMTDWGPTNTGLFRSGMEHKRTQLRRLAIEFPTIRWALVGDDGQHDPYIYREYAREHSNHVRAILIRELNPAEQFLAHGTTTELPDPNIPLRDDVDLTVPFVSGPDGAALAEALPPAAELDALQQQ